MAVIAIYSVKGGVGKTTLAANLAWHSATDSRRDTLLWDLDAAGGSTFLLGLEPPETQDAGRMLAGGSDPIDLLLPTVYDRLDVLPADVSLRRLEADLSRAGKKRQMAKVAQILGADYRRIILDCPPVLGELSRQVMQAADLVIVPLPPSPLSRRAFETVVEEVKGVGLRHPPILPVLSMVDMRRTLHRGAREDNPDWPVIPMASAAEQSADRRAPVATFAPRSPASIAFSKLWRAIERKLALRA